MGLFQDSVVLQQPSSENESIEQQVVKYFAVKLIFMMYYIQAKQTFPTAIYQCEQKHPASKQLFPMRKE